MPPIIKGQKSFKDQDLRLSARTCMLDDITNILKPLKRDLKEALGEKLLILIETDLSKEETQVVNDLVASYSLRSDIVISGIVYPSEAYHRFNTPFLQNIKEEGKAI